MSKTSILLEQVKQRNAGLIAAKNEKKKSREALEKDNAELQKKTEENLLEKEILSKACLEARKMSADIFSLMSTNGVQAIMGDNLRVKIVPGERNNLPIMDFKVVSEYEDGYVTEVDPTEEDGGGVADIVSMSNFIAMNIINSDKNGAPLILDEPTKFVSLGNAKDVGEFLKNISEEFGKQIIIVTHAADTAQAADRMFKVTLDETGTSRVTSIIEQNADTDTRNDIKEEGLD